MHTNNFFSFHPNEPILPNQLEERIGELLQKSTQKSEDSEQIRKQYSEFPLHTHVLWEQGLYILNILRENPYLKPKDQPFFNLPIFQNYVSYQTAFNDKNINIPSSWIMILALYKAIIADFGQKIEKMSKINYQRILDHFSSYIDTFNLFSNNPHNTIHDIDFVISKASIPYEIKSISKMFQSFFKIFKTLNGFLEDLNSAINNNFRSFFHDSNHHILIKFHRVHFLHLLNI